jgi:hypothetical protein
MGAITMTAPTAKPADITIPNSGAMVELIKASPWVVLALGLVYFTMTKLAEQVDRALVIAERITTQGIDIRIQSQPILVQVDEPVLTVDMVKRYLQDAQPTPKTPGTPPERR